MGGLWARLMLGTVIATTGFCGMALEVLLIFVFQSLYGYVYTRLGLIVAVFMCGLVLGAPSGRSMAGRRTVLAASAMIGLELLLVGIALGVPKLAGSAFGSGTFHAYHGWAEAVIYVGVGLVGWAVGAEFVLANRLFCDAGGAVGVAAAMTDASDHLGAAAGSFIVGVLLVPVLGIQASCGVLAALKGMSLLCLLSAVAAMPAQTISRPRE
jgi:spermidine synthase